MISNDRYMTVSFFFLYLIYMTWLIIIICSFRLIFKCEISFPISYNLENNRKNNDDITQSAQNSTSALKIKLW